MRVKRLVTLVSVGVLLAVVVIAAASAQSGSGKPYLEGEGGAANGIALQASNAERAYAEGEGARATGARANGIEAADRIEGVDGASGTLMIDQAAMIEAETLAPPGFAVLYRFSGVVDDGEQGSADRKVATSIHCTNLASTANNVFVEVFQWNGTAVYTGAIGLATGASRTFSTQLTTLYFDDIVLGGLPGTLAINQGHGVISAENSQIICTAQTLDPFNLPATYVTQLPLYRE